jgi:hypothetical protein
MTHQAISVPTYTREGVRGTSGRSPAVIPQAPKLQAVDPAVESAATELLNQRVQPYLAKGYEGTADQQWEGVLRFALEATLNPTKPYVRALAILADTFFDSASDREFLTALSTAVNARLEREAQMLGIAETNITIAYAKGYAAGQEELKKQLPAVVRETTFVSNEKGAITGKTEREFRPGGKS